MREILLPWDSQPQEYVELDSSLLSNILAIVNAGAGPIDLISGVRLRPGAGASLNPSIVGWGLSSEMLGGDWQAGVNVPRVAERLSRTLIWHGAIIGAETGATPNIFSLARNPATQDDAHAGFLRSGASLIVGFSFGASLSSRTYSIGLTSLYGKPLTLVWVLADDGTNKLYVGVDGAISSYTGAVLGSTAAPSQTGSEALLFGPDNVEAPSRISNVVGSLGAYLNIGLDQITAERIASNPWSLFESRRTYIPTVIASGAALCLDGGALVNRPFAASDRRVYLTSTGALIAKAAGPAAGDRLVSMVAGQLRAV